MGAIHSVIPAAKEGTVYWFHGNSGSGKTHMALQYDVPNKIILDGDDLRQCWDLGFSKADRYEQNLRIAKIARLLWIQGFNVCVATILPYAELREKIRSEILPAVRYVYVASPDSKAPSKEYPFEEGGWLPER
jgi:adenylylsulfate kinase-like enzyme